MDKKLFTTESMHACPVNTAVFTEILDICECQRTNYVIDIGASNGIDFDPLHCLYAKGTSGIAFEPTHDKFVQLCQNILPRVKKIKEFVTPKTVIKQFEQNGVPKKFDALNIDIDGYDFHVIKEILKNDYRPITFCVECNTFISPGIIFTVNYRDGYFWNVTHLWGCSFELYHQLMKKYGYECVYYDWENAYFVQKEYFSKFNIKDNSVQYMWERGYFMRMGRGHTDLFDWNNDVEQMYTLSLKDQIRYINDHEHFSKFNDGETYTLFLANDQERLKELLA